MNVGTLTISLAARTAALTAASARVKSFETGVVASAQRMNRSLLMLGQTFSSLTIPIAALGVTATKMFSDFEFEVAKVQGLVGIAASRVQEWGDQILKMAPAVARMPKELGEALYFVTSAGIRGKETMEVLRMSARGAAAGLGETKDVADAVTSAMNAYGKQNLSAAQATDILTMAVREGKVVAEDLSKSIGKVFPVAAQLEVSFNEVGAAIAAMTRTGTPASTSAIYLRRVLTTLLRPTNAASSALQSMGMSFYELRQLLQQDGGLLKALLRIRSLVDQFGSEEVAEVFPNIRALIPVLDIIGKNLEDNQRIWQNMLNPVGALDTAVAAASKTLKYQWDQSIADLQVSMVKLGETLKSTLIPIIQDVVGWVRKAVNWWTSLDSGTQQLITRITLLVATIGPLTVIIGSIVNALLTGLALLTSSTMLWAVALAFVASYIKQLSQMKSATEGMEDGIARSSTALEKFASNAGVYLNILFKKIEIFSIKLGIILGDIFSGLINFITEALNGIIKVYNFIMPMKGLDLPEFMKTDLGGYYREQLKIAEDSLQDFMNLRPGGAQAWNWADQLFGADSGFKDAAVEVWNGFKDNATEAINFVKNQLVKMFPTTSGSVGAPSQSNFSILPIDPFQKTGAEIIAFYSSLKQLDPMKHLQLEDLTKQWDKFAIQVRNANKQFERFGFLMDPVAEKLKAVEELMSRMRERGGIISEDDLNRLRETFRELENSQQLFNLIKEFEGYVSDEALMKSFKYLDNLKLTKSELDGVSETLSTLKGFDLFSDDTLLRMAEGIASLKMTSTAMKQMISVASFIGDMFAEIGVGLGKMIAGSEDAFEGLFNMLVSVFKQIGKMLANVGSILLLIPGFQGWGAAMLLGGIALSAIGGAMEQGHASRDNAANMATGGVVPGGYPNDTFPANLTSGEAVIPLDRIPQMLGVNQNDGKKIVLTIDGRQLIGVMEKQEKAYNAF